MNERNNADPMGAFFESLRATEVDVFDAPLYRDFGTVGFHEHTVNGRFDTARILREMPGTLVCSRTVGRMKQGGDDAIRVRSMLWKLGERLWVKGDRSELVLYASDLPTARQEAAKLAEKFNLPPEKQEAPHFFILNVRHGDLTSEPVKVSRPFLIERNDLVLHYGDGFPEWEDALVEKLQARISGVTLLRGDPGTGKTSFIRHLISRLQATHCFFYLPVGLAQSLGSPDTVEFWARQNNQADRRRNVVILEDAESLLEERTDGNRSMLEDFLNVSDGLMSEFLQLQVIATINCPVQKLDPAVTRAGRLLAYRNFSRMNRAQAQALALAKGLQIQEQEDFSIAEVYAGKPVAVGDLQPRKVGFAA